MHEGRYVFDDFTRLACGGLAELQRANLRRGIHAELGERRLPERLRLRFHDVRQLGEAGLVEPEIRRDHRRQFELHRLEAAVHLAHHARRLAAFEHLDLESVRGLRPAHQLGQQRPGLAHVVVDGLLAHQDDVGLFLGAELGGDARDRVRVGGVGFHENAAVRPHRQAL